MLLLSRLTVYSQTTLNDSIKCFTYSEARKIITDLRQLPIKDSIITKQDSIIFNLYALDSVRVDRVNQLTLEVKEVTEHKNKMVKRLHRTRKISFALGIAIIVETFILLLK